jgi:hypothetical protein
MVDGCIAAFGLDAAKAGPFSASVQSTDGVDRLLPAASAQCHQPRLGRQRMIGCDGTALSDYQRPIAARFSRHLRSPLLFMA